jgi:hypothetical protein
MKISKSVVKADKTWTDILDVKTMKVEFGEETMTLTYVRLITEHGLTPASASILFGVEESVIRERVDALNIDSRDLTPEVTEIICNHMDAPKSISEDILITAYGIFQLMSLFGTLKSRIAYHLIFDDLDIYFKAKEKVHELKAVQCEIEDYIDQCDLASAKATACFTFITEICTD